MESSALHAETRGGVDGAIVFAVGLGIACAPISTVIVFHLVHGIPIPQMTQDLAAIAGVHPMAGFLSNLGILLWTASAAIWSFSAVLLRAYNGREEASFAFAFGLFSSYLVLDDLFQLHEVLARVYLGFDEKTIYAFLAASLLASLIHFRRILVDGPVLLLAAAFLLLGASVAIDLLSPWLWRLQHWLYLLEDGLKWLGIVAWSAYCVSWCKGALLRFVHVL